VLLIHRGVHTGKLFRKFFFFLNGIVLGIFPIVYTILAQHEEHTQEEIMSRDQLCLLRS